MALPLSELVCFPVQGSQAYNNSPAGIPATPHQAAVIMDVRLAPGETTYGTGFEFIATTPGDPYAALQVSVGYNSGVDKPVGVLIVASNSSTILAEELSFGPLSTPPGTPFHLEAQIDTVLEQYSVYENGNPLPRTGGITRSGNMGTFASIRFESYLNTLTQCAGGLGLYVGTTTPSGTPNAFLALPAGGTLTEFLSNSTGTAGAFSQTSLANVCTVCLGIYPEPPTGICGAGTSTSVVFDWTPDPNPDFATPDSYTLQYRLGSGAWTTVSSLTSTTYTLSPVDPGSMWEWQVSATYNNLDYTTDYSTIVTCIPLVPSPPIGSCGTATMSSVTLEWVPASGSPVSYNLQYRVYGTADWTVVDGLTGTSYAVAGLPSGTTIEFQVQAVYSGDVETAFSVSYYCASLPAPGQECAAMGPVIRGLYASTPLCGWRGLTGINWKGLALVGDKYSNVIGRSDFDNFTEYCNPMKFVITTPPVQEDRKRIFVPRFEIDVQAGDGLPAPSFAGPEMMLDVSKDSGMTWGNLQKWRSMGAQGQYRQRLRWLNLGHSRAWVFRLTCTDPVRRQVIGSYVTSYVGLG